MRIAVLLNKLKSCLNNTNTRGEPQKIEIYYGQLLSQSLSWIKTAKLLCTEPEKVLASCQDNL